MCAKVGVDPLASNKGFWAELLGIGDLYYELGVQIVDVCLATRPHNGGLINLEELCKLLSQRRKGAREVVSEDDCLRAIGKLKDQYRLLGENVARLRTDLMKEQLSTFRSQLEDFARKHKVSNAYSWTCTDAYIFATPFSLNPDYYFLSGEHTVDFYEWTKKAEYDYGVVAKQRCHNRGCPHESRQKIGYASKRVENQPLQMS